MIDDKNVDAAIKNMEAVCERLQADLKTHQQLQADLALLKQLKQFWLDNKDKALP